VELMGLVTVNAITLPEGWAIVVERQVYEHRAILHQSMLCPVDGMHPVFIDLPMNSIWLPLRAMTPTGSSSGTHGGLSGATMAVPFNEWNRVMEAWVGVSRRADVEKAEAQGCHWSVYGNARRPSDAGAAVPLTEVSAVETVRPRFIGLLQCIKGYIIKPK